MTQQTIEFQTKIEQIANYTGSGTELVSVYLPPDASLQAMQKRITGEHSEAQNIKSKSTRQNVQTALSTIKSTIQSYDSTPENGLVIFSGVIQTETGTTHQTFVFDDLPFPIDSQVYHCDDSFYTDPLEGLGIDESVYAIIVLDRNSAAIGRLTNTHIETLVTFDSLVPGKQKKGGQSQQRFERLRLEAIENHYQKIGRKVNEVFTDDRHNLAGVLIGGPEITRGEFIDGEYLHHELQEKILYRGSVSSVSEAGVEELANAASDAIESAEIAEQKEVCDEFFTKIRDELAVYGVSETRKAIEYGSVDTLLISESYYPQLPEDIVELKDLTEEYGGTVEIIPTSFSKGEQFNSGFGGVGAVLRYQIT